MDLPERIALAIRIGESHYREFKSAWQGPPNQKTPRKLKDLARDVSEALVAFANSDGGELIIGVEDNGTITGVSLSPDEIQLLLNSTESHVHKDTPLPNCLKAETKIDGNTVLYFSVPKGTQFVHLTSDGRCLRRIDRDSVPFSAENITAQRLEDRSRTWDREIQDGATLADLDLDLVQGIASQIAYGVSVEKCLQYLDLAEFTPSGLKIKRAAVLLFAKDVRRWHSHCQVRVMTVRGKEKRSGEAFNVAKDDAVNDNIIRLVDLAWERLTIALTQQTQLTESGRFEQNYLYPQIACREALINAIVHRNYTIEGRGIEISIFQDRMEISSPGALLSTILLEDIKALKGVHESRNPHIARVLREIGLVREMGEGMRRIFDVMKSNALAEPEIESSSMGFLVTLYRKSLYDPNVKLWLSNYDAHKLTESQTAVLALGFGGKEFSTQDVIDRLGIVDTDQVRQIMTPLLERQLIERFLSDNQTFKAAKNSRVPKREVKTWRVLNSTPKKAETTKHLKSPGSDSFDLVNAHRLYLGNISYKAGKETIVVFLSEVCEVIQLDLPAGIQPGIPHRGFGFAFVVFNGTSDELINKLDGKTLNDRLLRVSIAHSQPRPRKS